MLNVTIQPTEANCGRSWNGLGHKGSTHWISAKRKTRPSEQSWNNSSRIKTQLLSQVLFRQKGDFVSELTLPVKFLWLLVSSCPLSGDLWFPILATPRQHCPWTLQELCTHYPHEEAARGGWVVFKGVEWSTWWNLGISISNTQAEVSNSSLTISNYRYKCKLVDSPALLSVGDDRHIETMCFYSSLWPGGVSENPQHKPWAPATEHRVSGLLNALLQTRFSTCRAKLLPYPISHQTLMDLMWESIITPSTLCGFALLFLRPHRLSWIPSICLRGPQHPV